jgi:2-polyprenyl-6-hydroxyphenyl methylase / 3-demethylubiquinone-9 3-methyltransferase
MTDAKAGPSAGTPLTSATVAADEIARFSAMADEWWDPEGEFRPLHELNPVRVGYIRVRLAEHFGRDPEGDAPLAGLRILDIGCGGGLVSEAIARLGATVTGIDASESAIEVARVHAARSGLEIDFRSTAPECIVADEPPFDAVLSLEVVEHVTDVDAFLAAAVALVKPGGAIVLATLNRTVASLLLAKIGAEYVLRWLPPGTHSWRKFRRPSELAAILRRLDVTVADIRGLSYQPASRRWTLTRNLDVNFVMYAIAGPRP